MQLDLTASAPYFDDMPLGTKFATKGSTITEDAIIQYGLLYDPQPFHIDRAAAKKSIFGALVASGFQVLALSFRAVCDTQVLTNNLGGNQAEDLKWSKPVLPNATIKVEGEVVDARESSSKKDRGILKVRYVTTNENDEEVLRFTLTHIFKRRSSLA
jgi:acyl dehydratase